MVEYLSLSANNNYDNPIYSFASTLAYYHEFNGIFWQPNIQPQIAVGEDKMLHKKQHIANIFQNFGDNKLQHDLKGISHHSYKIRIDL